MTNTPMPSYNPEWSAQPAVAAPVRPQQIQWAFWLILAAAVLNVFATIFGVIQAGSPAFRQQIEDQIAKSAAAAKTANAVDVAVALGLAGVIISGAIAFVLYLVIGWFINKGHGWARITGLVLAVVSLTRFAGLSFPGSIFTILQVVCGIVAIVLCFIQPGTQFFKDRKAYKLATKLG